jgi:hypothetical protein
MIETIAEYFDSLETASGAVELVCPMCGNIHTHFGGSPTVHPYDGSHESVRLLFYGECGHQWVWVFMFHAGRIAVHLDCLSTER